MDFDTDYFCHPHRIKFQFLGDGMRDAADPYSSK